MSSDSTDQSDRSQLEQHPSKDFFISYTHTDQYWAEWIAWQLEEAGYTTILQAWDFHAGGNFVLDMDSAAKQAERTIAVLSPDYLTSSFTPSEWAVAFRDDPKGEQGLLMPVRVLPCNIKGLLGQIVYIDLVGLDEQMAQTTLLARVKRERHKPTKAPAFPFVAHTRPERPTFPAKTATPASPPVNRSRRRLIIGAGLAATGIGIISTLGILYEQHAISDKNQKGSDHTQSFVSDVGGWSPTGSMRNHRLDHSVTQLLDGTVLVAAGRISSQALVTQAERFYPKQGTWVNAGEMNTPRITIENSIITLNKGKYKGYALLVGGANAIQDVDYSTCELYNPANNSWILTGSLNIPRRSATLIALPDGRVLVIGGSHGLPDAYRFQPTCELFDPDTEKWTYTPGPLAYPREGADAVLFSDETVLIAGGEGPIGFTNWVELYNIKTGLFSSANPMPWGWVGATMTVLSDGRVLVTGGQNHDTIAAKAALYNLQTDAWTETVPMSEARCWHSAFLLPHDPNNPHDRVLISGGGDVAGNALRTSEIFDVTSGTWSPGPSFTSPRAEHRLVSLERGDVLAIGGYNTNETGTLATCELFTPASS